MVRAEQQRGADAEKTARLTLRRQPRMGTRRKTVMSVVLGMVGGGGVLLIGVRISLDQRTVVYVCQ